VATISRILPTILCAAAISVPASAADVVINDLRFGVGFSITDDSEVSVPGTTIDYDAQTLAFSLQYMRSINPLESWGGLIFGGELFYSMTSGDAVGGALDVDVDTYGIQGYFGYAYAMQGMPLHFEVTPYLGLGMANTEISNGGASDDDDDTLIQYGLRAAGYYTFANKWQAGLELRYQIKGETKPNFDSTEVDEVDVEMSGLQLVLQGGYRF